MPNRKGNDYSIVNNIAFIMKKAWAIDKVLLFSTFVKMPIVVLVREFNHCQCRSCGVCCTGCYTVRSNIDVTFTAEIR